MSYFCLFYFLFLECLLVFSTDRPCNATDWRYDIVILDLNLEKHFISDSLIIETTRVKILEEWGTRISYKYSPECSKYFSFNNFIILSNESKELIEHHGAVKFEKDSITILEDEEGFANVSMISLSLKPGSVWEGSESDFVKVLYGSFLTTDMNGVEYDCWAYTSEKTLPNFKMKKTKYIDRRTGWLIQWVNKFLKKDLESGEVKVDIITVVLNVTSAKTVKWEPNWW